MSQSPEAIAEQVRTRGWAFVEPSHDPEHIRTIRETVDELRARYGDPPLYARDPEWIAETVEIAAPGLAFYQLMGHAPQLAPIMFSPAEVAAARAILGDDMQLELIGAVTSDETRPFTEWETHLGGIDDERWRIAGKRPRRTSIERIVRFLFLEDLTEDTGPWRVIPHAIGDPVEPVASINQYEWPGAVHLTCPVGSVLLLAESVWHSVTPRRVPGVRHFIGAYFATASAGATVGRDRSLDGLGDQLVDGVGELFASLLVNRRPP